ncbi:MAG: bacterioferritin [Rickettsiales bacterium]|nr:bacterioferritin [Rickettsiales bacterium]
MAGHPEMIKHLNVILKNELTAINQYFLHSRMLEDMGVLELAKKEYEESIDEMKHADELVKRILFLEGLPNLQDLGKLMIGEHVKEMLECDLKMEFANHEDLQAAHDCAIEVKDPVSEMLVKSIMDSEEEHIDWLQQQLKRIELMGIENYIATQSGAHSD